MVLDWGTDMPLWEFLADRLIAVPRTSFEQSSMWERRDLQRLLRDQPEVLGDDLMVIAEEFSNWVHSDLRVDLLCIDRSANLVVVELKRDDRGGHAELQAIRYASMVAPSTFEQVVEAYRAYTARRHRESDVHAELTAEDARLAILDFLEWDAPDDDSFGNDVRIILAAADFSIPLTSAVLWLRSRGNIDIRCVRLMPYAFPTSAGQRLLVDVQQLVPLPEVADLTDRMADKEERKREARASSGTRDYTRFDLTIGERNFHRLPKRWLAYETVRAVLSAGVRPERILEETAEGRRRGGRMLVSLGQSVSSQDEAVQIFAGLARDPSRFFTRDELLLHFGGQTWVFTKGWGTETLQFVHEVAALAPDLEVEVLPATGSDQEAMLGTSAVHLAEAVD